jgi:hypothetical protein
VLGAPCLQNINGPRAETLPDDVGVTCSSLNTLRQNVASFKAGVGTEPWLWLIWCTVATTCDAGGSSIKVSPLFFLLQAGYKGWQKWRRRCRIGHYGARFRRILFRSGPGEILSQFSGTLCAEISRLRPICRVLSVPLMASYMIPACVFPVTLLIIKYWESCRYRGTCSFTCLGPTSERQYKDLHVSLGNMQVCVSSLTMLTITTPCGIYRIRQPLSKLLV